MGGRVAGVELQQRKDWLGARELRSLAAPYHEVFLLKDVFLAAAPPNSFRALRDLARGESMAYIYMVGEAPVARHARRGHNRQNNERLHSGAAWHESIYREIDRHRLAAGYDALRWVA